MILRYPVQSLIRYQNQHRHLHHRCRGDDCEEVPADYVVGEVVEEGGGAEAVGEEAFVDGADDGGASFLLLCWKISSVA
jgi:hypothetical protein